MSDMPTQSITSNLELNDFIADIIAQLESDQTFCWEQLIEKHPHWGDELHQIRPALEGLRALGGSLEDTNHIADEISAGPIGTNRALGDFEIIREIGRGGMGVVYEAQQLSVNRRVALKVLPLAALLVDNALARFLNEVRAAASLEHPNIVSVYMIGEERGIHYYAMRLIRGKSLAAVIGDLKKLQRETGSIADGSIDAMASADPSEDAKSSADSEVQRCGKTTAALPKNGGAADAIKQATKDTLPIAGVKTSPAEFAPGYFRTVARLTIQAAKALDHAHQQGVIHRDVKPGNLLLDKEGKLFVTDFGLARIEADAGLTLTGDFLGTLRYMSPEQISADHLLVDHRTDIYSLGATLFELLTLRQLYEGDDRAKLIKRISEEEPPSPKKINSAIPIDLETIVLKAINKNPADRYPAAGAFADDLQCFLDHRPILARRPTLWRHLSKWSYRHRLLIATATLAALLSLGAGLSLAWSAYNKEAAQRARAQDNYRVAMRTLDDVIDNAAQMERMIDVEGWRRTTLERALVHFAQFVDQNAADPEVKNEILKVREKQAKIHLLLADFPHAEAVALTGVELVGSDPDAYDSVVAAKIWSRLAEAYHEQAKTELAADAWQHAYDQIEPLFGLETTKSALDALGVANFLRSYAQWQIQCGSPRIALQSLLQAADECRLATNLEPQDQASRFLLGEITEDIANRYRRAGDPMLAIENYNAALALANDLSDTRAHLQLRAKCLRQLGTQLVDDRHTLKQAEEYFRQAIEIYDRLVGEYPWDVYYRGEFARLLHVLAVALRQQGNNEEAQELLARAATEASFDINDKPLRAEHQLFWAQRQWTLANIARDLRQFDVAKQYYESALDHFEELATKWKNYREIHEDKANVHNDYAAMILAQPGIYGNAPVAQQAEAQIRVALEIFQKLQFDFPELKRIDEQFPEITGYYSQHLRYTYTILAKSLNAQLRFDDAKQALRKAKAEFDRVPRLQSAKSRYQMADTLLDLAGTSLMGDENPVEVEQMYRDGLQMMNAAFAEDPQVVEKRKYTQELITHYWGLAEALYDQERYEESKQEFERARGFGPMWVEGLDIYAGHLLHCEDESFQDYQAALECYQEILERGPSRGSKDKQFIGQKKLQIGVCHFRLGDYKNANGRFSELMTDAEYSGSFPPLSLGYYLSMTLALIDEADDTESDFSKADARECFDVTWQQHQKLLNEGKIVGSDVEEFERLQQEAAEVLGLDPDTINNKF